ncbi:adenine-specific DNA-methyltransferase [Gramella sp. Hel_I_59]|uniref:site-specific DNA-methyltransferase n=1 Tax=Gramella sp. Hel_I_59 TaxID=1249978 RepID=UPI00114F7EED|nr:site-specific DNA-methyltransferase [Gramella sp. Hel_I_59]TQI69335.1 adenine-specific DNA-methyltransferase [Gramella sp. Hel_I_59]
MPTLNWIGKEKVVNHHQDVPFRILEHKYGYTEKGEQTKESNSGNKIIQGDNLEALKSLLPEYEGKVDCIYIDPPYNTGNELWVYNDNVKHPKIQKWLGEVVGKEDEDFTRQDKWLCMLYPRLKLLSKLLSSTGSIWISIDDNSGHHLKLVLDEIFGKKNFIACNVWQKRYSRENRGSIGDAHEYIFVYSKNPDYFKANRNRLPLTEKQAKIYRNPTNDPRGRWRTIPMTAQGFRPNQMYEIEGPDGSIHVPPEGRCWSTLEENFLQLKKEGKIYFGKKGDAQPSVIRYLSEVPGIVPWTWWPSDEVGHTDESRKEIRAFFGTQTAFETPKPTRLIERIIGIATQKNDIILDSFAGSATTANAVLNLNKKDSGNRKFILVEMEDYADSITSERVKKVIKGYGKVKNEVEGTGGSFDFYELGKPIFKKDHNLNEDVAEEKIRNYIFYSETKQHLERERSEEAKYLLDNYQDTGYYFYYEKERLTTLDLDSLNIVAEKQEQYIIYADTCLLDPDYMLNKNIIFKKIPRDIKRF